MLISEDLLLLATDDADGKAEGTLQLDPALAGAVLMDLVIAGRVDLQGEGRKSEVVVIDSRATGNPILDSALQILIEKGPTKPVTLIGKLQKGLRDELYTGLAARGIVRREEGRVLWVFPTTSWPATDSRQEDQLRRHLTDVLIRGQEPTPRVAALVALLSSADLLKVVVDKPELKAAKDRGKEIAAGNWTSDSVKQAIQNAQAAITAAVMVSTTAVVMGGAN